MLVVQAGKEAMMRMITSNAQNAQLQRNSDAIAAHLWQVMRKEANYGSLVS
jgi:hypothetical protein